MATAAPLAKKKREPYVWYHTPKNMKEALKMLDKQGRVNIDLSDK